MARPFSVTEARNEVAVAVGAGSAIGFVEESDGHRPLDGEVGLGDREGEALDVRSLVRRVGKAAVRGGIDRGGDGPFPKALPLKSMPNLGGPSYASPPITMVNVLSAAWLAYGKPRLQSASTIARCRDIFIAPS